MTAQTIPTSGPALKGLKLTPQLQPGDWVASGQLNGGRAGAAEIISAHPYVGHDGIDYALVVFREVGAAGPDCEHVYANKGFQLATPDEVEGIRTEARRLRVAVQLRQLADLIVARELPLPNEWTGVEVRLRYTDVATVQAVATALGLERKTVGSETAVQWPNGDPYGGDADLRALFFAYAPRPSVDEVDRTQVLTPDGSDPVPADVQGLALGGGENRPVSAPPADGGAQ